MRGRVAVQARKRLAAERAAQRLASGLAAMCRTARRGILDEFPDQPHPPVTKDVEYDLSWIE
jgi:hypothetical protein